MQERVDREMEISVERLRLEEETLNDIDDQ